MSVWLQNWDKLAYQIPLQGLEGRGGKSDPQEATTGVEQILRKKHQYEQDTKKRNEIDTSPWQDGNEKINTRRDHKKGSGGDFKFTTITDFECFL